jgi:prolyl-tRNA editing enzyme YbaK/EbsC (Cys-tRNA(Pro) deacylase)
MTGTLVTVPAWQHPELLASPVAQALAAAPAEDVLVAEIDPAAADTVTFCQRYGVPVEASANCVVVAGRRGDQTTLAACVALATTRVDVNGVVRRHLGARKASFAPMEIAVQATGMEYGGITPFGLPPEWPVLVDARVVATSRVVVGSGVRRSKLVVPGPALAALPGVVVLDHLATPAASA